MLKKLKWSIAIGLILTSLLFITILPIFALAGNGPARFYNDSGGGISIGDGGGIVGGGAIPPNYLQYQEVNPDELRAFLKSRGSYLVRNVDSFIANARMFGINPVLLVAITGQEQSFDPEKNSDAAQVGRNPFNVFGSWMAYSPGFDKSCEVAARTVAIKLSHPMPPGEDPIHWLNNSRNPAGSYAEDPNWWKGVKFWFQTISSRPNIYLVPLNENGGAVE